MISNDVVVAKEINWTPSLVLSKLSDREIETLQAEGQNMDNIQWRWGRYCRMLIEKYGIPKMAVFNAIAKTVGRSQTTIRNCYYTSVTFSDADREQYENVAWSIFNYARQTPNPDAVLMYAFEDRAGVDECEMQFPITKRQEADPPEKTERRKWPVWCTPIRRRINGLPAERYKKAFRLLERLLDVLEE